MARATAANSGLWEDPTLGVNLARIVQSTPEPWKVFTNLGITLPISGRLAIEQQRADAQYAAELSRLAAPRLTDLEGHLGAEPPARAAAQLDLGSMGWGVERGETPEGVDHEPLS